MKIKKRSLALLMTLVMVMSVSVGVLAYFTDNFQGSASATAGTLDIVLADNTLTIDAPEDGMKPGQGVVVSYTLKNTGNKSADILETLVLTVKKDSTAKNLTASQPEFSIYNASDVVIDSNDVVTVNSGAEPVGVVSGNRVTVEPAEYILNGSGANAETETGAKGISLASEYVIVFNKTAGNDFQGLTLTLDFEAQAKQHRNTDSSTWATVQTVSTTFAGDSIKVVPAKN